MSAQRVLPTIFDLLRYALPVGTAIVAGRGNLNRAVTWTSVLQTLPFLP